LACHEHAASYDSAGQSHMEHARSVPESVDCRAALSRRSLGVGGSLSEGGRLLACHEHAASYDSAGQSDMKRFTYVYILQSENWADRFYIGRTLDLRARLSQHNAGRVPHTAKWKPWRIKTYLALSDRGRATALERYLKSASGRAFVKHRL